MNPNIQRIMMGAKKASGGGFSPIDIPDLDFWFNTAQIPGIGAISQMNDLGPNGYHATQPSGPSQPITGSETINGKNVLSLDGSKWMSMPDAARSFWNNPTGFSIYTVYKTSNPSLGTQVILGQAQGASTRAIVSLIGTGFARVYCHSSSGNNVEIEIPDGSMAHITGMIRDGSNITAILDQNNNTLAQGSDLGTLNSMRLFSSPTSAGSSTLVGNFCEMIGVLRSVAIGSVEDLSIRSYLKTEWGTP